MNLNLFLGAVLLIHLTACDFYMPKEDSSVKISEQDLNHPTFLVIKQKIFEPKCIVCHAPGKVGQRIPLDTREDLLNSPLDLVIPWNIDDSTLLLTLTRTDSRRMPPPKSKISPVTAEELKLIETWISEGCGVPRDEE